MKAHGGAEYGKRAYALVARALETVQALELHVALFDEQELPQELYELLPPEARQHRVADFTGIVDLLCEIDFDRFYSPVPYYLAPHANRLREATAEIRCTIHGTRYLELGWDRIGYAYRGSLISKARHLVKRMLRSRIEARELRRIASLVNLCDGNLLTVSQHTRSIAALVAPERTDITVAQLSPLTATGETKDLTDELSSLGLTPGGYYLVVSSNRVEKNAYRVALALSRHLPEEALGKSVVFLGANDSVLRSMRAVLGRRRDAIMLEYVARAEYEALVANCHALVYPSLSEGFGYPPLEVMRYGKPAIVSGTTAMPTVYRDGVLFVDPRSPREIAARMWLLANDQPLYDELASATSREVARISAWLKASEQTTVDYITK